jgi:uncharacterized protein YcfL
MIIKKYQVLWSIIILLLVVSCQSEAKSKKEEMFSRLFPSIEMNKQLELQVPELVFGEGQAGQITLNLFNNTSDQIILPESLNYQIFFYSDQDGWQKIRNLYNGKGSDVVLEPKESGPVKSSELLGGLPDPKEIEGKENLRMVVLGFIYKNGKATNAQVGAFVDVNLKDYKERIVK